MCVVLVRAERPELPMAEKRLENLAVADADIVVFQPLPRPLRSRVLEDGRVEFVLDEVARRPPPARAQRSKG